MSPICPQQRFERFKTSIAVLWFLLMSIHVQDIMDCPCPILSHLVPPVGWSTACRSRPLKRRSRGSAPPSWALSSKQMGTFNHHNGGIRHQKQELRWFPYKILDYNELVLWRKQLISTYIHVVYMLRNYNKMFEDQEERGRKFSDLTARPSPMVCCRGWSRVMKDRDLRKIWPHKWCFFWNMGNHSRSHRPCTTVLQHF